MFDGRVPLLAGLDSWLALDSADSLMEAADSSLLQGAAAMHASRSCTAC